MTVADGSMLHLFPRLRPSMSPPYTLLTHGTFMLCVMPTCAGAGGGGFPLTTSPDSLLGLEVAVLPTAVVGGDVDGCGGEGTAAAVIKMSRRGK